jgi:hypothetical protein
MVYEKKGANMNIKWLRSFGFLIIGACILFNTGGGGG